MSARGSTKRKHDSLVACMICNEDTKLKTGDVVHCTDGCSFYCRDCTRKWVDTELNEGKHVIIPEMKCAGGHPLVVGLVYNTLVKKTKEEVNKREEDVSRLVGGARERVTEEWMIAHTKNCPNCTVPIEKNEGCNHMTCKHCRHEFFWDNLEPLHR